MFALLRMRTGSAHAQWLLRLRSGFCASSARTRRFLGYTSIPIIGIVDGLS